MRCTGVLRPTDVRLFVIRLVFVFLALLLVIGYSSDGHAQTKPAIPAIDFSLTTLQNVVVPELNVQIDDPELDSNRPDETQPGDPSQENRDEEPRDPAGDQGEDSETKPERTGESDNTDSENIPNEEPNDEGEVSETQPSGSESTPNEEVESVETQQPAGSESPPGEENIDLSESETGTDGEDSGSPGAPSTDDKELTKKFGHSVPKLQVHNAIAQSQFAAIKRLGDDIANLAAQQVSDWLGNRNNGRTAASTGSFSPLFGIWASGRVSRTEHDGFDVQTAPDAVSAHSKTADFEATDASLFVAGQIDLANATNQQDIGLKIGIFGGLATTDVDLGTSTYLREEGIFDAGSGENDSSIAGAFGVISYGPFYAVAIASGQWGETEVDNKVTGAKGQYDTDGYVVGGLAGVVVTLARGDPSTFGDSLFLNLRTGVSHTHNEGEAHTDSLGNRIGKAVSSHTKGIVSGELSTVVQQNNTLFRPFVKIGFEYRLDHENSVEAENVEFLFYDDDNNFFGELGVRFKAADDLDISVDVRADANEDQRTISGKLGMKYLLN